MSEHVNAHRVAFILLPGFALTSFSLAVEALSVANRIAGQTIYDYRLYSAAHDEALTVVTSSDGIPIQTHAHFSQCQTCDTLFLCAYQQAPKYENAALFQKLKRLFRKQCRLASLSSGSFILAKAGLLNGSSCTLYREQVAIFQELYPHIAVQENIYTVNSNILTCSGGITALDMLLYMIGQDHGREFALEVSEPFCHDHIRTQEENQHANRYLALRMKSACLGAAIEVMEANIERPYSIQTIAEKIGSSIRTLEITFQRYEQMTPNQYYVTLRLNKAKALLEDTNLSASSVAQATGFASQSYFSKRFKALYGLSPQQSRSRV